MVEKIVSIFTESTENESIAVGDVVNLSSSEHDASLIHPLTIRRNKKIRFIIKKKRIFPRFIFVAF